MSDIGDRETDLKFTIDKKTLQLKLSVEDMTTKDVDAGFFAAKSYIHDGKDGPPSEFVADTEWENRAEPGQLDAWKKHEFYPTEYQSQPSPFWTSSGWHAWQQLRLPSSPIRVAPTAEGSEKTINTLQGAALEFTYMDVGFWGDSLPAWKVYESVPVGKRDPKKKKRDFGLVWGEWTCLCKYNNPQEGDGPDEDPLGGNENPLNLLLKHLRESEPDAKVQVRRSIFTKGRHGLAIDRGVIYVIIPDLHLPVVLAPPANLEADRAPMGRISATSIPLPFVEFNQLNIANTQRIGEWYEQYAKFNSFGSPDAADMDEDTKAAFDAGKQDVDYSRLISPARDLMEFLNKLEKCTIPDIEFTVVQVGDMYELWKGFECFYAKREKQRVVLKDLPSLKAQDFIAYWVGRTNKHFESFFAQFNKLKPIRMWGNHDNYLASYGPDDPLTKVPAEEPDDDEAQLRKLNLNAIHDGPKGSAGAHQKEVRKPGILIEHGHRSDSFNRDGSTDGHDGTRKAFRNLGFNIFDEKWGTQREARIFTAAVSFLISGDFCVYAMGHTHEAHLTRVVIEPKFV